MSVGLDLDKSDDDLVPVNLPYLLPVNRTSPSSSFNVLLRPYVISARFANPVICETYACPIKSAPLFVLSFDFLVFCLTKTGSFGTRGVVGVLTFNSLNGLIGRNIGLGESGETGLTLVAVNGLPGDVDRGDSGDLGDGLGDSVNGDLGDDVKRLAGLGLNKERRDMELVDVDLGDLILDDADLADTE